MRDLDWLKVTLHGIDRVFWDDALELAGVTISWARFRPVKKTIRLGSYWYPVDTTPGHITMHPVLAQPWVPSIVVSYLVYHETVHATQDAPGTRRWSAGATHDLEFRKLEARHPHAVFAAQWLEDGGPNMLRMFAWRPGRDTQLREAA